ncbi:hypothetical protein PSAC2689_130008 [Paraburkholderia sacchari]
MFLFYVRVVRARTSIATGLVLHMTTL